MKLKHLEALHELVMDLREMVKSLNERVGALDVDIAVLHEIVAEDEDEFDFEDVDLGVLEGL